MVPPSIRLPILATASRRALGSTMSGQVSSAINSASRGLHSAQRTQSTARLFPSAQLPHSISKSQFAQNRCLSTGSHLQPGYSGGKHRDGAPSGRRGMFTASSIAFLLLLPTTYLLGSLYPPSALLLMIPRAAAPPLRVESEEGKKYTEDLENSLQELPIVKDLKSKVENSEGDWYVDRPLKVPMHPHSLTSAILRGPSLLALPPLVFSKHDESEAVIILHLGRSLCGHDGIVHGGLLATVFDEGMARVALMNIQSRIGVTATMDIKYRKPVQADQFVVIRAQLGVVNGRKLNTSARMENLDGEVLCEAKALFVEPKYAKYMRSPFREPVKPPRTVKATMDQAQSSAIDAVSAKYVAAAPNEDESSKRQKTSDMMASMFGTSAPGDGPSSGKSHPPGVVLDENGKPCKVCNSFKTWSKVTKKSLHTDAKAPAVASNSEPNTITPVPTPVRSSDCPLDVEELGRATWSWLHTMAAYYPDKPSAEDQKAMEQLISSFSRFYPCSHCAADFRDKIAESPVDTTTRARLSRWMCDRHNEVNEKLGKERFDCGLVDERWRDGWKDGRCD